MQFTTESLFEICNKYNLFTCGSNTQYKKLFDTNRDGASIETLATIIWICSTGYTELEILEILRKEQDYERAKLNS